MISLEHVTKNYGDNEVFKDISVKIEGNNIVGIIANNGMGKSVLLRMLCKMEKPTEGKIIYDTADNKTNIGMLIEKPGYIPDMAGYKYLVSLSKICNKTDKETIRKLMETIGLNPDSKVKIKNYSIGMKQKLGIVQAIMEEPEIIIIDEPFTGIDESGKQIVRNILLERRCDNRVIILTGHYKEELDDICNIIYEIKDKEIHQIK